MMCVLSGCLTRVSTTPVNGTLPQANATEAIPLRQGWTSQVNGRGSLDIIWSCVITMILCSWSVLCLNVPAPNHTRFGVFRRKLYLTGLALSGPEFIFQSALGQWLSSRRSVADFHASGYSQWTMTHAFFADMGGFVLHTKDWVAFPVNARQLHYLVVSGYVAFPRIDRQDIADKNKADGLIRIITLCQIAWFSITVSGRAAQQLAITCAELTTAAFIVCSAGTMYCWRHKPADVTVPEIIESDRSIADILLEAGDLARLPYSQTPLDFVGGTNSPWTIYWTNWMNLLRRLGIVFAPRSKPVDRFENTLFHGLPGRMEWVSLCVTALYFAVFVSGWNYDFPTQAEQTLWRAASMIMLVCPFVYGLITESAFHLCPALLGRFAPNHTPMYDVKSDARARRWPGQGRWMPKARSVAARIRNNSLLKNPALDVPLKAILPMYVLGVIYCHARLYVFVADAIELRSLPSSAYLTVDWAGFIPHF